jgi:hypothetical protein
MRADPLGPEIRQRAPSPHTSGLSYRTRQVKLDLTQHPEPASSAPARVSGNRLPEFPEPHIFHQREYPREQKPTVIYASFPFFEARSLKKDPFDIDTNYGEGAITQAEAVEASESPHRGGRDGTGT